MAQCRCYLVDHHKRLRELQFWGHGCSGAVFIGGAPLHLTSLTALRPLVADNSRIWFRSCHFMNDVSRAVRVAALGGFRFVAGHRTVIHLVQGDFYVLDVAAASTASDDSGVRSLRWVWANPRLRLHSCFVISSHPATVLLSQQQTAQRM